MDLNSQSQKEMDIGKTYGEKTHIKQKDKSNIPSFISKTYEILEKEQLSSIIMWGQSGNNFYVKSIKEFEQKILPVYFRHKNFASFVRQLNMYDFHKIRGEQKHIFQHKLFKRGAYYLLEDIKRKCFKKYKDDEAEEHSDNQEEIQQLKSKKIPLCPTSISNIQDNQSFQFRLVKEKEQSKQFLEKQKEKEKLYYLIAEERSKNRKRNLQLMEQILCDLKEINFQSESQIRQHINVIKCNPRYHSLRGKYYIYEIYRKLKQSLYQLRPRNTIEDLDQLSIEEQILYNEIQKPQKAHITSLTNFETEKFLKSSHHTIKQIYGEEFYSKEMF